MAAESECAMDLESPGEAPALKKEFYRVELNKTVWEVPERYQELTPIGTGAYGSVWYE